MMNTNITDYLDGVPLELSSCFYPLPDVNITSITNIQPPQIPEYDFCAERKAIDDFALFDDAKLAQLSVEPRATAPKQSIIIPLLSESILQPIQAPPPQPLPAPVDLLRRVSLRDFENMHIHTSPFEELEIKSIDDKEMLRQVLSGWYSNEIVPVVSDDNGRWPHLTRGSIPDLNSSGSSTDSSRGDSVTQLSHTNNLPAFTIPCHNSQRTNHTPTIITESVCGMVPGICLNEDERRLLSMVVNRGFDVNSATRCIKAFNCDTEKVLCAVNLIGNIGQSSPFTDPRLIEDAVIHSRLDETKARQFIFAVDQLRRLGFPDSRIVEAVSQSQGSRDRALELLLGKS